MKLRHGTGRPRHTSRSERGETLIELMATIVLIGVSVVALVGALINVLGMTARQRSATRAGNETVNIVETLRSVPYEPCATTDTYEADMPPEPPGWSFNILEVEWLKPPASASAPNPNPEWVASTGACTDATDQGVQRITISAVGSGPSKTPRTLTFVKRTRVCPLDETGPQVC